MNTLQHDILTAHRVDIPPHLTDQAEVHLLTGVQRQGDVLITPTRPGINQGEAIPATGVPVVRGEAGGNTHLLVGDGTWHPTPDAGLILGTVTVPDTGAAYLLHPEHGATGLAPGSYTIRRQREQADEIRVVAD